MQKTAHSRKER